MKYVKVSQAIKALVLTAIIICALFGLIEIGEQTSNMRRHDYFVEVMKNDPIISIDGVEVDKDMVYLDWYTNFYYDEDKNILYLKTNQRR